MRAQLMSRYPDCWVGSSANDARVPGEEEPAKARRWLGIRVRAIFPSAVQLTQTPDRVRSMLLILALLVVVIG
jgi:hypothetical protein